MADQVDYELVGDDMQAVIITLDPGETIRAEVGAMMYMDEGIDMQTSTGGGLVKGLKRIISGENFFITSFTNEGRGRSRVAFSAPYPAKIIPLDLSRSPYLCQRSSYLCSAAGIEISIAFTKRLGAGFFGGEGFILQRLEGHGLGFVHAGGTIVEKDLAREQTLRVDTGCLVAFQPTVDYSIQFVGGIKTALFGGEGLFFARLQGPGKVYLQTLPFSRMADQIISASGASRGEKRRGGGGLIGNLLSGR